MGTGLKEIGDTPFINCNALESVYFYEGLEYMDGGFNNCKSLVDVWIPSSLKEISNGISHISLCPNMIIHTPAGSVAEEYG